VAGGWWLVAGLWSLVSGLWSLVSGLWSLVSGLWSRVQGPKKEPQIASLFLLNFLDSGLLSDQGPGTAFDYGPRPGSGGPILFQLFDSRS
jgi:hypothetical protein